MDEILCTAARARVAHFVIEATSLLGDVRRLKLEMTALDAIMRLADEDTGAQVGLDDLAHRLGLVCSELEQYRGSPDPALVRADRVIDAYELDRDLTDLLAGGGCDGPR